MPLKNPFTETKWKKIKTDKQILIESRVNKLRKIEGQKPIDFGPNYIKEEVYNYGIHSLLE